MVGSASLAAHPELRVEMQSSDNETRRVDIWEQLRVIEDELFLLSEVPGERNVESRRRFQLLCGKRTRLASKLLLTESR